MASIPLVDLQLQHAEITVGLHERLENVCQRAAFILGEEVEVFESAFAEYQGVKHCIGVGNGTDALELGLRAMGVGPDDEVIVPTNSFIASALAVVRTGARPVLVDVDPHSYLIDPEHVATKIGPLTKAIMPIHLYGQIAMMDQLMALSKLTGVAIMEDAAQAHGASQNGIHAGGFGAAAGTSFYPGKNLGAYGDAGAVLTNSDEIASNIHRLRNHGSEVKYHHTEIGFNSRLDTIQAVVLSAKLPLLTGWNEARQKAASVYDELLGDMEIVQRPTALEGNSHVWHLYVVQVPERDIVLERLNTIGVGAGVHYPIPIHLQKAFGYLGYVEGDFPVAEQAAGSILSLPIYPGITVEQQERVVTELVSALV